MTDRRQAAPLQMATDCLKVMTVSPWVGMSYSRVNFVALPYASLQLYLQRGVLNCNGAPVGPGPSPAQVTIPALWALGRLHHHSSMRLHISEALECQALG
jgi:hypothetical protein